MTGVALALAASLSWGIADFGGGIGTRRVQVVWVLLVSQLAGLALVGALALATLPHPPTGRELAWGAFGGAMGAVGLGSFYRALAIGSMGIVGPISATGAIVPVAYARGERPSVLQAVGIIVAVGGVVAASLEPLPEGEGRKIATGVPLALLAAGLFDTGANLLYGASARHGLISVVSVLGSLYPVVLVVLARFVLAERIARPQLAGVAVALAGVALISAG